MWSILSGIAVVVFFAMTYTLPGPFNPLLFFATVGAAAAFGFALSLDLGRWKKERERSDSQPRSDHSPQTANG